MGKIVTNKNYPSYPKEFQNNFKKLFKISYITEEGTIISEPNKLNLDAIELFDNFFYAYSSSYNRVGRSVKKNYNWNDFCQFIYDLNREFYSFLEKNKCGIK